MGCTISNRNQSAATTTETLFLPDVEMSPGINEEIDEFVARIAGELGTTKDVLANQRRRFHCEELPLDSAPTPNRADLGVTQLIHTIGNNALHAAPESTNHTTEYQSGTNVLCSVAASGMGKTHLAYTSANVYYSIIIRVGLPHGQPTKPRSTLAKN
jgi:chromosomal replication initiation ATPase DnaA